MTDEIYRKEVVELHQFLSAWLKGEVPRGDGRPERLAQVLAEDLYVIHPNGKRGTKAEAVRAFAAAYGEKPPGYALEIGRVETRMLGADVCLATYEEWHRGEPGRARVASALLRRRADGRVEWLFLQETPAPHLEQEGKAG